MSSVSGVGNSSLYQWLQQLTGNQQASAATASTANPTDNQDPPAQLTGVPQEASGHHRHHHGGGFARKIEASVTTALQSAPSGSDPNQVIKDAITQALQAGKPDGAGVDGDAQDSISGNSTASSSTTVSGPSADGQSAFNQLLGSFGVTGQQFQQDVQAALGGSASGSGGIDFATLFKSFPPGSYFQATA